MTERRPGTSGSHSGGRGDNVLSVSKRDGLCHCQELLDYRDIDAGTGKIGHHYRFRDTFVSPASQSVGSDAGSAPITSAPSGHPCPRVCTRSQAPDHWLSDAAEWAGAGV